MKVTVYAVGTGAESWAGWSIAPEVDYAFWCHGEFRAEAERTVRSWGSLSSAESSATSAKKEMDVTDREVDERDKGLAAGKRISGERKETGRGNADVMVAWSEPLPLGHALEVVRRWPAGKVPPARMAVTLSRLIDNVWAGDARMGLPVPRQPAAHAEHVLAAAELGDGRARALAARACRAAALLQGRALLGSEALALLEAAGAAGPTGAAPAWSAWAPALQLAALLGRLRLGGAVAPQPQPRLLRWRQALGARPRPRLRCQRCGSGTARMRRTACAACGRACAYCEACLTMGRSRECGLLILGTPSSSAPGGAAATPGRQAGQAIIGLSGAAATGAAATGAAATGAAATGAAATGAAATGAAATGAAATGAAATGATATGAAATGAAATGAAALARWSLSPAQTAATEAALAYLNAPPTHKPSARRRFLLWAVTGAGKTEMIFPLIESCLARGGRALIATPRRDVVLELDPRIRKAFPEAGVVTLYGGSEQRWEQGEITLATTHQLFRFREGFDLVVVDEIDAFPYHGDPMLHYAAENVRSPSGAHVLLSATPPAALRMEARFGRLAHVRVPVRFHRHPLPVPTLLRIPPVHKLLKQQSLPRSLVAALRQSLDRGAQLFVFVQHIRNVEPLAAMLRSRFPGVAIEGTSSQDPERARKVQQFRERTIRLLVTTTILERGVTVPKSDVFILDADGKLFDEASLIQMAGRAGRSKDDPAGRAYFCASARTRAQQSAIAQIRSMNRMAKRKGYLIGNERKEGDKVNAFKR